MQSIFTKYPEKWHDRRKMKGKYFCCGEGNTFICKQETARISKGAALWDPLKLSGYLAAYLSMNTDSKVEIGK